MNDPIRIIAEQAFADAYSKCKEVGHTVGETDHIFISIVLGKLTDQIIQECARIADIEKDKSAGCGYITKTKGEEIKEYFGIK